MKIYRGRRLEPGQATISDVEVTVEDTEAGTTKPLAHFERHSPTGFSWGYGGSGSSDLALAIMLDLFGDDAYYQEFKWGFVANWSRCWEINSDAIRRWRSAKDRTDTPEN